MDKVFLTRLLPLDEFGYYAFASNAALALVFFTGPVMAALFPRMVKAYEGGDHVQLSRLYHGGSQLVTMLVVPTGSVLALFSHEILQLWTKNTDVAAQSAPLLSLLAVATMFNLLVNPAYSLQAGAGYNRMVLYIHLVSVVVMGGVLLVVVPIWGTIGAAVCWVGLYFFHLSAGPILMHRKLLVGELGRWWREDVLIPALGGVAIVLVGRMLIPPDPVVPILIIWIGLVWVAAMVVQLLASSELRPLAEKQIILVYRGAFSGR
jgi:O-antigen/teichoic acid export membrane protein